MSSYYSIWNRSAKHYVSSQHLPNATFCHICLDTQLKDTWDRLPRHRRYSGPILGGIQHEGYIRIVWYTEISLVISSIQFRHWSRFSDKDSIVNSVPYHNDIPPCWLRSNWYSWTRGVQYHPPYPERSSIDAYLAFPVSMECPHDIEQSANITASLPLNRIIQCYLYRKIRTDSSYTYTECTCQYVEGEYDTDCCSVQQFSGCYCSHLQSAVHLHSMDEREIHWYYSLIIWMWNQDTMIMKTIMDIWIGLESLLWVLK